MNFKLLSAMALFSLAPLAVASPWFKKHDCYIGAEAIQTNQKYVKQFGDKIFTKNTADYNLFVGLNFKHNFGLEAGFEFQPNRDRLYTIVAGDSLPGGATLISGDLSVVQSTIKASHPYLGLFAERKYTVHTIGQIRLHALLGVSVSRVQAFNAVLANQLGALTTSVYNASIRTYAKTKIVPIVKIAGTYFATDHIGVRLSANYRNMRNFKIKSGQVTSPQSELRLKDNFGIGLGLVYLS
jgi:hypothetical protein